MITFNVVERSLMRKNKNGYIYLFTSEYIQIPRHITNIHIFHVYEVFAEFKSRRSANSMSIFNNNYFRLCI